jgi:radical SAM modification target selenobiotic family peptide
MKNSSINRPKRREIMDTKRLKKLLAGLGLAGLLAGAGLTNPGCATDHKGKTA